MHVRTSEHWPLEPDGRLCWPKLLLEVIFKFPPKTVCIRQTTTTVRPSVRPFSLTYRYWLFVGLGKDTK